MRNLYADLAEYTKRPQVLVEARCIHASVELAWQFEKHKGDPLTHYRESDMYSFASTRYQMGLQAANFHEWFKSIIQKHEWKSGLDFGGGIGEETINAMEAGVKDMTFLEVSESRSLAYAVWRFEKYKVAPTIKNEGYLPDRDFDFIVAMDVFEHLENPQPVIEAIAKHTKFLFCNPTEIKYNWLYPQHISEYKLEPYFERIEHYLFRKI